MDIVDAADASEKVFEVRRACGGGGLPQDGGDLVTEVLRLSESVSVRQETITDPAVIVKAADEDADGLTKLLGVFELTVAAVGVLLSLIHI